VIKEKRINREEKENKERKRRKGKEKNRNVYKKSLEPKTFFFHNRSISTYI